MQDTNVLIASTIRSTGPLLVAIVCSLAAWPLRAAPPFRSPVAISFSSGPAFPQGRRNGNPPDPTYAADKAIDGDLATFCCLLDDTLTGYGETTIPARAAAPVTGHLVLDLGEPLLVTGLRLTGRKGGGAFNPKNVDVFAFAEDDPTRPAPVDAVEDDSNTISLVRSHTFGGLANGRSEDLNWEGIAARFIGLRVNTSYETGDVHHNFQIAEIAFSAVPKPASLALGDRIPSVYARGVSLSETMLGVRRRLVAFYGTEADSWPAGQVKLVWDRIQADFPPASHPLLEDVDAEWFADDGWFARGGTTDLERAFIDHCLAEMAGSNAFAEIARVLAEGSREPPTGGSDASSRWHVQVCMRIARLSRLARKLTPLALAVDDLGETFPGVYPVAELRARLAEWVAGAIAVAQHEAGGTPDAIRQLSTALTTLQRDALVLRNPLLSPGKLLFVKRYTYSPGWYYAEFMRASRFGGALCTLSLPDGKVTELAPGLEGGIFDRFDLSFDGERVVFGYKAEAGCGFRLFEVGVDGAGLRQLTFAPPDEEERIKRYWHPRYRKSGVYRHHTDDFHPCYLPDGGICFASTRCERGVLCAQDDSLSVNVLYRMGGDGSDLHMLSQGALSESTPTVMNDGRILYTRWEYVDKGVIAVQSLWCMRPDGSGSREVYGNEIEFPPVFIHGRAIPGRSDRFVCTATMHHPFAVGPILLLDTSRDIRTHAPIHSVTPRTSLSIEGTGGFPRGENYTHLRNGQWVKDNRGPLFSEPYPLADPRTGQGSGTYFLVTCNPDQRWNHPTAYGLYLIDTFGNRVLIYRDPGMSCWQPVPLRPRFRPPVLPRDVVDEPTVAAGSAVMSVSDVYAGLPGVPRGSITYLRVLEQVPRPWSARRFWPDDTTLGQQAVISMYAHIYVKVLHGIVPVQPDGSACFRVPADRSIFFQALDADFMEVKRMRTFVNVQPGEARSCVGCHEPYAMAPPVKPSLALVREPSPIVAQPGDSGARPIHYPTDVQPILDRHCIRCHSGAEAKAKLDLTGALTTHFSRSYEAIMKRKLVSYIQEFVGPQPRAQKTNVVPFPPYQLGSHASKLIGLLRKGHQEAVLERSEWVRLVTWVDANAPYYGSYFGKRNLKYRSDDDFRPVPTLAEACGTPPPRR